MANIDKRDASELTNAVRYRRAFCDEVYGPVTTHERIISRDESRNITNGANMGGRAP